MTPDRNSNLLGVFSRLDLMKKAVETLVASGYREISVYSPIPLPEIEAQVMPRKSPVSLLTLFGGIIGCIIGMWFPIWTAYKWSLITGGKPVASIPAYVIISFELTMLLGGLATLFGVFVFGGLPARRNNPFYDARFSQDRFGLALSCAPGLSARAEQILKSAGAEEVRIAQS